MWMWKRLRDLCLSKAAMDDDLFTRMGSATVSGLCPDDAVEKWCRLRGRLWSCCWSQLLLLLSILLAAPSAALAGAPSSWKTSGDIGTLRYCHGFFPATSRSRTSALNLLTSSLMMFLCPWMAAMWSAVWPHVDLELTSNIIPSFWTPYLQPEKRQKSAIPHQT